MLARIEKIIDCWFILATLFIFFLLRLPSLIEPYWYGDEGIYQVIGLALRSGRLLYTDIWDNKPPLLYILYALFSSDQFSLRAVSILFGILSIIVFYFLAKRIFAEESESHKKKTYITTSFFALLFSLPLLEGNIANAENFMLLPILLSAFLVLKTLDEKNLTKAKYTLFLAGIFASIAFLFKIVGLFDFIAFVFFITYFFLVEKPILKKNMKDRMLFLLKIYLTPYFLGFLSVITLTSFYFLLMGGFGEFVKAFVAQNVGYVAYGNTFIIPQGFLILKSILLFFVMLFLFKKNKIFEPFFVFTIFWLLFSLFNAFFSQRPYTHYLLVLLPSISLVVGFLCDTSLSFIKQVYRKENHIRKNMIYKLSIFSFLIIIVVLLKNFNIYGKIIPYYKNFFDFVAGRKNVPSYQAFFDSKTPRDYEIAQYLKLHSQKEDGVFIWGNNAQLYTLLNKLPPGRFIVLYHIVASQSNISETENALLRSKPKYVIIMDDKNLFPYELYGYAPKIVVSEVHIYERIL